MDLLASVHSRLTVSHHVAQRDLPAARGYRAFQEVKGRVGAGVIEESPVPAGRPSKDLRVLEE